ncbi:MAG: ABC transporter permease [Lachnospiraceae bacterium]|jgi:ABC-2 type transport system permease protein
MSAIYKKEVRGYLTSMIGYVFIAFILVVVGIYFTAYNLLSAYPDFGATLNGITFVFLIITPILTMRILAEEKKQKTDQLLFTAPIPIWKVILGKYLGLVTIFTIPMAIICIYPLIMSHYGTVSFSISYVAILGFFLLGCANIAIGVFLSSVTESQVIAAVLTFLVLFACFVMEGIQDFFSDTAMASFLAFIVLSLVFAAVIYHMTKDSLISGIIGAVALGIVLITYLVKSSLYEGGIQKILNIFNISEHLNQFIGGVFDLSGVIYMLSVAFVFLFLTVQSVEKRRWS